MRCLLLCLHALPLGSACLQLLTMHAAPPLRPLLPPLLLLQAALGHVLDVVSVVGASAALQEDGQSERVSPGCLAAFPVLAVCALLNLPALVCSSTDQCYRPHTDAATHTGGMPGPFRHPPRLDRRRQQLAPAGGGSGGRTAPRLAAPSTAAAGSPGGCAARGMQRELLTVSGWQATEFL